MSASSRWPRLSGVVLVWAMMPAVLLAARLDPQEVERADAGDPRYQLSVGVQLLIGAEDDDDRERGRTYLEQSRAQGIAPAAAALGYIYAVGNYLPPDPARAARNYEMATAQENTAALREYGLLLWYGNGLPADKDRATRLIERSAQLGDGAAKLFIARVLDASDAPDDTLRAREWRDTVAPDRAAMIASYFALHYAHGVLLPTDRALSDAWWDQVDVRASHEQLAGLASYYSSIVAPQRDPRAALTLFERLLPDAAPETVNSLAWLLATTRDESVRDGNRAVDLMEALLESNEPRAAWVDTLASAYAEIGDFDRAVETQREALAVSTVDEIATFGEELDAHLNAYEAGQPWRE